MIQLNFVADYINTKEKKLLLFFRSIMFVLRKVKQSPLIRFFLFILKIPSVTGGFKQTIHTGYSLATIKHDRQSTLCKAITK